jgi:hypothetical protein
MYEVYLNFSFLVSMGIFIILNTNSNLKFCLQITFLHFNNKY